MAIDDFSYEELVMLGGVRSARHFRRLMEGLTNLGESFSKAAIRAGLISDRLIPMAERQRKEQRQRDLRDHVMRVNAGNRRRQGRV